MKRRADNTAQVELFPNQSKTPRHYIEPLPETSRDAYESVDLRAEQERVLRLITDAGVFGLTADEVEEYGGCGGHQRLSELRRAGRIRRTGDRRRTRAGKLAEVYIAV